MHGSNHCKLFKLWFHEFFYYFRLTKDSIGICLRNRWVSCADKSLTWPKHSKTPKVLFNLFKCQWSSWKGTYLLCYLLQCLKVSKICSFSRSSGRVGTTERFRHFSDTFTQRFQSKAPFFSWCWWNDMKIYIVWFCVSMKRKKYILFSG